MKYEGIGLVPVIKLVILGAFLAAIVYSVRENRAGVTKDTANHACSSVCEEQTMSVIRSAFDSKLLPYDKADQVVAVMEERCQTECKLKLGIDD